MIKENIYVYAIISAPPNLVKSGELMRSMLGINNRGIILMPCKDFIAVASNIHLINLDRLDKKELAEFISIHEQINNRLIKDCDVVPMRFGMIVESREEVLNVLEKAYLQFKMSLANNFSVGNFDLIDSARKTLGLGEEVTILEIKKAYYELAAQYHPDKHEYKKDQAVLEETTKKMKDITAANEVLNAYCKYHFSSLVLEKNQSYSLRKIDVENSIIVKE